MPPGTCKKRRLFPYSPLRCSAFGCGEILGRRGSEGAMLLACAGVVMAQLCDPPYLSTVSAGLLSLNARL